MNESSQSVAVPGQFALRSTALPSLLCYRGGAFRQHFLGSLASGGSQWGGQEEGRTWGAASYLSLPGDASLAKAASPLQFQLLLFDSGLWALAIPRPPSVQPDPKSVAFTVANLGVVPPFLLGL